MAIYQLYNNYKLEMQHSMSTVDVSLYSYSNLLYMKVLRMSNINP